MCLILSCGCDWKILCIKHGLNSKDECEELSSSHLSWKILWNPPILGFLNYGLGGYLNKRAWFQALVIHLHKSPPPSRLMATSIVCKADHQYLNCAKVTWCEHSVAWCYLLYATVVASSQAPPPPEERPGTHCLRMRVISPVLRGFVK